MWQSIFGKAPPPPAEEKKAEPTREEDDPAYKPKIFTGEENSKSVATDGVEFEPCDESPSDEEDDKAAKAAAEAAAVRKDEEEKEKEASRKKTPAIEPAEDDPTDEEREEEEEQQESAAESAASEGVMSRLFSSVLWLVGAARTTVTPREQEEEDDESAESEDGPEAEKPVGNTPKEQATEKTQSSIPVPGEVAAAPQGQVTEMQPSVQAAPVVEDFPADAQSIRMLHADMMKILNELAKTRELLSANAPLAAPSPVPPPPPPLPSFGGGIASVACEREELLRSLRERVVAVLREAPGIVDADSSARGFIELLKDDHRGATLLLATYPSVMCKFSSNPARALARVKTLESLVFGKTPREEILDVRRRYRKEIDDIALNAPDSLDSGADPAQTLEARCKALTERIVKDDRLKKTRADMMSELTKRLGEVKKTE